jgi:hypothetical protein
LRGASRDHRAETTEESEGDLTAQQAIGKIADKKGLTYVPGEGA